MRSLIAPSVVLTACLAVGAVLAASAQDVPRAGRFSASVDVVHLTVTVSDEQGRAITGLTREDFEVFEDGQPRAITYFDHARAPVSLGLAIDTSGSMEGEKLQAAREALDRFLFHLLAAEDEVFLYRIADAPDLVERWTRDRRRISQALRGIEADGGTALLDTVALAAPLAQTGRHRKKALLVISDGNDTSSGTTPAEVRRLVRDTEVIVYAIGIDAPLDRGWVGRQPRRPRQPPAPPFPVPGRQPPWLPPDHRPPQLPPDPLPGPGLGQAGQGLDLATLRAITDDSGGRTEVVRGPRDLAPATAGIAAELNQQYALGFEATSPRDGRWHAIDVRVRGEPDHVVRHRRGYQAGAPPAEPPTR